MSPRPLTLAALSAVFALAVGCGPKKPPPTPEPVATAAEPPPPPPKCEAFAEKCAATAETRAKITNTELIFTPASGWIYAQLSSATVAQTSETGPAIAFTGFEADTKDKKKDAANRDATFGELLKQLGVAPLKKKIDWKKKPTETKSVGDLKIDLWQLDEQGVRAGKKGTVIVVAGNIAENKGVMGLSFVPDDDAGPGADAVLKSIDSIGKAK
jgi:hypothetical protein